MFLSDLLYLTLWTFLGSFVLRIFKVKNPPLLNCILFPLDLAMRIGERLYNSIVPSIKKEFDSWFI